MRGSKHKQLSMLTPMTLDGRVPKRHPLPAVPWMKTVGGLARSRLRSRAKTQFLTYFAGAAYNLLRMAKLEQLATS